MRFPWLILVGFVLAVTIVSAGGWARGDDEDVAIGDARNQTVGQLKQLGIAFHKHHDKLKTFPPPAILSKSGQPLLSWRVKILPFIEQDELYQEFHLDEAWDSPHNQALIAKMPDVYYCAGSNAGSKGRTVYQVPRGETTAFPGPDGTQVRRITDGLSNTICIVETDDEHAAPWTKPDDWKLDPDNPAAGLGGHFPLNFYVEMCDGSVHPLPNSIDAKTLAALFTSHGGEVVTIPDK